MILQPTIHEIIKTATAEQKILWNEIIHRFGERIAVLPTYWNGPTENAPFYNLVARKIYIAYSLDFGSAETRAALVSVIFDDELGNSIFYASNNAMAVSPQRFINYGSLSNIYFSRCQIVNGTVGFQFVKFVGFTITY